MNIPPISIAVDGCSSTGKSSFAKLLSKRLGFNYLDSGALYRAITLFAQENDYISEDDIISDTLEAALQNLELHFEAGKGTFMAGRCIENEIRSLKVSSQVSPISTLPFVRNFVDKRLHELAMQGAVVMDGRDIGTTVLPNAEVKIFMTSSVEVRAQRRYDELKAKGQNISLEEVTANLLERDRIDSSRATSPLRCADDAVVLDNSYMTMEEEIAWALNLIENIVSHLAVRSNY